MKISARKWTAVVSSALLIFAAGPVSAQPAVKLGEAEALQLGIEAYIYAYPLVTPKDKSPSIFDGAWNAPAVRPAS